MVGFLGGTGRDSTGDSRIQRCDAERSAALDLLVIVAGSSVLYDSTPEAKSELLFFIWWKSLKL